MQTRRDFLASVGAALAASALPRRWSHGALEPVGIQLYTLRRLMQRDVAGTLQAVAVIGYREVEFAGYFGHTPNDIRALLDRHGLRAPAAHVPYPELGTAWDRVLDEAAAVGHRYVVTPWLTESQRTRDGYQRAAEAFNRAGEAARARGLRFAYHNHEFEFESLGDGLPYDLLLEQTDPSLVLFELDLFWIRKGGQDPLAYFARHPGRFRLVHVKDMAADGTMVDVGDGRLDFAAIASRARQAGIEHYFVEHDNPANPLRTARRSYEALRALRP